MSYEHKENTGSLFKNDRKETESQPDYKGSAKIGGVDYWVSGWINETNGKKYVGLSVQPKDATAQANPPATAVTTDDDVTF